MRRVTGLSALTAVVALLSASGAAAQTTVFVGGAATIPVGGYAEVARTGWMAFGRALFGVGDARLSLGAEGFVGSNRHDITGEKSNLYGGTALVGLSIHDSDAVGVSVFGGVGGMIHSRKSESFPGLDTSKAGLTASVGAGLEVPLGPVGGFLAGTYTQGLGAVDTAAFPTRFLAISGGVTIPLGG